MSSQPNEDNSSTIIVSPEPEVDQGILKALDGANPTLIVITILAIVLGRGLFSFLNRREDLIHEREMKKLSKENKDD